LIQKCSESATGNWQLAACWLTIETEILLIDFKKILDGFKGLLLISSLVCQ